jgi:hypothetical protein
VTAAKKYRDERTDERKSLARRMRAAIKKISAYALDGGTYETARKTEQGLYRLRDKLSDELNREERFGDDYPPVSAELLELNEQMRAACSAAARLASEARTAAANRQIAKLQEKQREDRAALEASGLAGYTKELALMRGRK